MKKLVCALAMAIAIVSPSVPARATVIINANGGNLVVNNGIILVHNNSSKLFPGTAIMHLDSGIMQDKVYAIGQGDSWLANKCCYAAGTRYELYVHGAYFSFTPHLCFRNGIPYGYAELTVNDSQSRTGVDVVERHGTCYEGSL